MAKETKNLVTIFSEKDKEALQNLAGSLNLGLTSSVLFDRSKIKRNAAGHPYMPGPALDLVASLNEINKIANSNIFRFKILSTNDADVGLKVLESCNHYDIPMTAGAVFGNGPIDPRFLKAHEVNWFLTTNHDDAQTAHNMGIASCSIDPNTVPSQIGSLSTKFNKNASIHFVLDLDRVVFGDEADELFRQHGPEAYFHSEREKSNTVIEDGPFTHLPMILSDIIRTVPALGEHIKISALTARGDWASLRAFRSLNKKGLIFNGGFYFSGRTLIKNGEFINDGLNKGRILEIICDDPKTAHIFLDDSLRNIDNAKHIVTSGLVPIDQNTSGFAIGDDREENGTTTSNDNVEAITKGAIVASRHGGLKPK